MPKLVRITTVPISMMLLLKGQMKFMKENGFEVTMISSDGIEIPQLIQQEGCPHLVIRLTRKITPFTDLISLIKLTFLLRKLKPDIVHTHTPKAGLIGMWAARFSGVPVRLHTIAGLPWIEKKGMLKKVLITIEKLTALTATAIFPNSFVQRDYLYSHGIARGKMKVIGSGSSNGINSKFFSSNDSIKIESERLRKEANVPNEGWVWIFVGRIVKDKGIAELVDAFEKIYDQFPNDRLFLVGEEEAQLDPLEPLCRNKIYQHPAIISWGFQKDIRPFLAASKILVFPSYREGFPNVPLQAGSMGCMLILSDINGCNEIVKNGVDGMLVPPKNSAALTNAMLSARKNPNQTNEFASLIKEKISQNYSQQVLWQLILKEYQHQLKSAFN